MALLDRIQEWIIKARTGQMSVEEVVDELYGSLLRRIPENKVEPMLRCIVDIIDPKVDRGLGPLKPYNILLQFRETEYVYKSQRLKKSFELVFLERQTFPEYQAITDSLRVSDWERVDRLLQGAWNTTEHFVVLFPLFFKMYYAKKEITLTQFQTVLAIQQMRWAFSTDNPYYAKTTAFFEISFWDKKSKGRMFFNVDYQRYIEKRNSVLYLIRVLPPGSGVEGSFFYNTHGRNQDILFPIPETYKNNFLIGSTFYSPRLVIGSLKSSSLVRFMYKYKERPYLCHHPLVSATHNTLLFDHYPGEAIFVHWLHDYFHTYGLDKRRAEVLANPEFIRNLKRKLQLLSSQFLPQQQQECLLFTDTGSCFTQDKV